MHKVVLIEKYTSKSFFWPNLLRDNNLPNLSLEHILCKYDGFEGKVMAFFHFNDIRDSFDKIISQFKEMQHLNNSILLHVFSGIYAIPSLVQNHSKKVGYDVGICEEGAVYSSIFHESLFGKQNELAFYKDFLNDHFLFDHHSLAEKYVTLHDELSEQGRDVEDYMDITIYEIWKQKIV